MTIEQAFCLGMGVMKQERVKLQLRVSCSVRAFPLLSLPQQASHLAASFLRIHQLPLQSAIRDSL